MKKTSVAVVLLCMVAGAAWFVWQDNHGAKAQPPAVSSAAPPAVMVEAIQAEARHYDNSLLVNGSVHAPEQVMLATEVDARIVQINTEDGAHVRKGQVLFVLDDTIPKAALQQATATLQLSVNNLKRKQALLKSDFTSQQAVDEASAQLKLAEANVAHAKAELAQYRIHAPFDGVIGIHMVSPGAYVQAGAPLVQIVQRVDDQAKLKVQFDVPQHKVHVLQQGGVVQCIIEGEVVCSARIDAWGAALSTQSRQLPVQATISDINAKVRPGQFVQVSIPAADAAKAVSVPLQALVSDKEGQQFVFIITADSQAKRQPVQVIYSNERYAFIKNGVRAGDMVVSAGQQKLKPGMVVSIKEPTHIEPIYHPEL